MIHVPGPGEVALRLEYTDPDAAQAIITALTDAFGDQAVRINRSKDRSRPHGRRREPAPGLTHTYTTFHIGAQDG